MERKWGKREEEGGATEIVLTTFAHEWGGRDDYCLMTSATGWEISEGVGGRGEDVVCTEETNEAIKDGRLNGG